MLNRLLAPLVLVLSPLAAAQNFDQCGTVEAGVTCLKLFRADDMTLWILDTPLTSFNVGDRIRVTGTSDPTCITICGQGDGCILNSQLGSCGLQTNICTPGVPNSTGNAGSISATGSPAVADDDVTLTATDLPPGSFAFFITSTTAGPPIQMPGGSLGNLCLSGTIGRFQAQVGAVDGSGNYSITTDPTGQHVFSLGGFPTPTGPVPVMPGDTWFFQCWHRDNAGGTTTSNFTEGFEIQFT